MRIILFFFCCAILACVPDKKQVDAIYYNAYIYSTSETKEPFRGGIVILNDTIILIDSTHKILYQYDAPIKDDLDLKSIFPKNNSTLRKGNKANIEIL